MFFAFHSLICALVWWVTKYSPVVINGSLFRHILPFVAETVRCIEVRFVFLTQNLALKWVQILCILGQKDRYLKQFAVGFTAAYYIKIHLGNPRPIIFGVKKILHTYYF